MQIKSRNEQLKYTVANGKTLELTLPEFSDSDCAFILGVRKSGSTLLNKIIISLSNRNQVPTFSIADLAFKQNLLFKEWQNCRELNEVIQDGIIYTGFRSLPKFLGNNPLFKSRKKIFLVRDPRDAIVSEFFSVAYNHSVPKANQSNQNGAREDLLRRRDESKFQGIDKYVLENARHINKTIMDYINVLDFEDKNLQVYRYEDIITNKQPWIEEMAQFLNLELPKPLLNQMLERFDVIPNQETSDKFIRKAIPGDHKDKLTPETIEELNIIFKDILDKFYLE